MFKGQLALFFIFSFACCSCFAYSDEQVVATFDTGVSQFAINPVSGEIYGTWNDHLVVFDPVAMEIIDEEFMGEGAFGVTVSQDGTRVYVSNSNSEIGAIGVYDVASREHLFSIDMPTRIRDIAVGNNHIVFATALGVQNRSQGISYADGLAGQHLGNFAPNHAISGGLLRITLDGNTLIHQEIGFSPSDAIVFDVSGEFTESYSRRTGSNGQGLAITNDGLYFAAPNGGNSSITLYDVADGTPMGRLATGIHPRDVAFSPDNKFAYAVHTRGEIDVFNLETLEHVREIDTSSLQASELIVDATGRYLFASIGSEVRVFSTCRIGDVNQDGAVNLFDIIPFINALASDTYQFEADTNNDSAVDFSDIIVFVEILGSS